MFCELYKNMSLLVISVSNSVKANIWILFIFTQSARKSLESDHGDPFTLLNAYDEWIQVCNVYKTTNVFAYTCIYAPAQQEQKVKMWNNRICESLHIYTHNQCVYLHHLEAALTLEEEEEEELIQFYHTLHASPVTNVIGCIVNSQHHLGIPVLCQFRVMHYGIKSTKISAVALNIP